ncbi:MAG TPA: M1 family metallopeptidase [Clostridia bacterium]
MKRSNPIIKKIALLLVIILAFLASSCGTEVQRAAKSLSTYTIKAVYDEYNHTVTAHQKIKYINNYDVPLKELKLHLYPNAFREGAKIKPVRDEDFSRAYPSGASYGDIIINEVYVAGKKADFKIGGEDRNVLTIKFPAALYPSASFTIEFDFILRLANTSHRLGYTDKCVNLGNWFPIACVYEDGGYTTYAYYPNGDPFYSEAANFYIELTLNSDFFVAATGRNTGTKLQGKTKTLNFEALAVRDFAFVLSKEFLSTSATAGDVVVTYFYYDDSNPEIFLKAAVDAVNTYSKLFGQYPYPHLNVIKTPFIHGGMEYPCLVYISDSITNPEAFIEVIAHEVAHQWWYGVVGNDQVKHAWMDEGLTEYATSLFYEKNPSYNQDISTRIMHALQSYLVYVEMHKNVHGEVDTSMNRPTYSYKTEQEYVYMTYVKGALMFYNIRNIIGDKAFFDSLKKYYDRNKFKLAAPEDLIGAFEDASKKDLEGVFNAWLEGKVYLGDW